MTLPVEPPPIDSELSRTVWPDLVDRSFGMNLTPDDIPRIRSEQESAFLSDDDLRKGGRILVSTHTIRTGDDSDDLEVLVLRSASAQGPRPCLYYTANGGKIVQSPRQALTPTELDWVADLGIVLVSVSPRPAPEHPHPAQIDDAMTGLAWLRTHAAELGVDPENVIVFGKSGGGGIAAATALRARDEGAPPFAAQLLCYPMIDDREVTVSSRFEGIPWDRVSNRMAWTSLLGENRGTAHVSPYAAPARCDDLSGLPPTYLETCSTEVFRDEILDYSSRLCQAGVSVELHMWNGGFHAFEMSDPNAELSRAAITTRTGFLRRILRDAA